MSFLIISSTLAYAQSETAKEKANLKEVINKGIETAESSKRVQSGITGLENAMIHVTNEKALKHLQENLERFQQKFKYKYDRYDILAEGNSTIIQGKREVKFLFFNFNAVDRYEVDEEGNIIKEQRNLRSRFFNRNREK